MDKYAQQAAAQAAELVASLSELDVQLLREHLAGSTRAAWNDWCEYNASAIREFVKSTPSLRRREPLWREHFPILVYAAYLHCAQAYAMLHAVSQHDLTPGGPYRGATARAGEAFQTVVDLRKGIPDWPWGGKSPFARRPKREPDE